MAKWAGLCLFSLLKVAEGQGVIRKKVLCRKHCVAAFRAPDFFKLSKFVPMRQTDRAKMGQQKNLGATLGAANFL